MDLNKHIISDDNNKPFHSSGYAKVASGNRIGSVGVDSFSQRQNIEKNRQKIGMYRRSAIGNSYGVARAKQYVRPDHTADANSGSLQQHNSITPITPRRFTEPSGRSYNPYS